MTGFFLPSRLLLPLIKFTSIIINKNKENLVFDKLIIYPVLKYFIFV